MDQEKQIRRTRMDVKIDHQFTPNHKIFGRYSQTRNRVWGLGTGLATGWEMLQNGYIPPASDQPNGVISEVHMFNPHVINEFRLGYNRTHVNTSNKTELTVGYGTLYGDLAGTISPLGDLTKPEVYALARYINGCIAPALSIH